MASSGLAPSGLGSEGRFLPVTGAGIGLTAPPGSLKHELGRAGSEAVRCLPPPPPLAGKDARAPPAWAPGPAASPQAGPRLLPQLLLSPGPAPPLLSAREEEAGPRSPREDLREEVGRSGATGRGSAAMSCPSSSPRRERIVSPSESGPRSLHWICSFCLSHGGSDSRTFSRELRSLTETRPCRHQPGLARCAPARTPSVLGDSVVSPQLTATGSSSPSGCRVQGAEGETGRL